MMPEGLARSVFEDAIAKKLDLDLAALREELAGERPRAATRQEPRRAEPPQRPERRAAAAPMRKLLLPGPAADALALLAVFPDLAPAANEHTLPDILPAGPLAELARALIRGELSAEEAISRLATVADDVAVGRARAQPREHAERELRKASSRPGSTGCRFELVAIGRETVKAGTAGAAGRAEEYQRLDRMRRDLEKVLKAIEGRG